MPSLGFISEFWSLLFFQIPFLICATWVLPREWKRIKATFKEKIYHPIWSIVLFNFIFVLLLGLLGSGKLISSQVIVFHRMGPLATFFLTCLIAPVAEECFFRYLIFSNFAKNNFLPYLLSFFGFIIAHMGWFVYATKDAWSHLLGYGIFNFYLIYLYRQSGWNLAFPIVAHFLNNLVFFILVFAKYK